MSDFDLRRQAHDRLRENYQLESELWSADVKRRSLSQDEFEREMKMRAEGFKRRVADMHERFDNMRTNRF